MRTTPQLALTSNLAALVALATPALAQVAPAKPVQLRLSPNGGQLEWTQPTGAVSVRGWNVYRDDAYVTTVHLPRYALPRDARGGRRYYVVAFDYTPGVPRFSPKSDVFVVPTASPPSTTASGASRDTWLAGHPRSVIWSDEFDGRAGAPPDPRKWSFYTPQSPHRTGTLTRDHASLDGRGHLSMRAVVRNGRAEMSYLKSFDDTSRGWDAGFPDGNDFLLDPTQGPLYVETAVRLDGATRAFRAWWAFWLMGPNANFLPVPYAPYDGNAETGTEVDIFEWVPDVTRNGWNAAVYTSQNEEAGLHPNGRRFTCEDARTFRPEGGPPLGIDLADGAYHRIGLYYSTTRLAFYLDDRLLYTTTDRQWITGKARNGIRLTWESDDGNVWAAPARPGETFVTQRTQAEVLIDYVRVSRVK
ncbi:MAG: glycoside hydrolase family 16 protein [Planctomycetota bacterium]